MPHAVDHNAILDRLAATRGGVRNVFEGLDPARTAHLVVDMQNGFMEPGAPVEVPEARGIVDNVNRIIRAMREAEEQHDQRREVETTLGQIAALSVSVAERVDLDELVDKVLPAIGRSIGIPDPMVAAIFSLSALLWAASSPWWARASDRHGRKPLMLIGLSGFMFSMICVPLVTGVASETDTVPLDGLGSDQMLPVPV